MAAEKTMKPLAVVIPSKTASNLVPCVAAVRWHEPDARIIVVDDGVDWDAIPLPAGEDFCGVRVIAGAKPFVFARNANKGIRAAGDADVVLLNDDALLESPRGFSLMQQAAADHWEIGVIGAVTDSTGAREQWRVRAGAASAARYVDHIAFVCVLIPARTMQRIQEIGNGLDKQSAIFTNGLLDERYVTYGWEDNDYIRQCKTAGLRIAVHDGCYVNHTKLKSTFRGAGGPGGDIEPGRRIYQAKWGKEYTR